MSSVKVLLDGSFEEVVVDYKNLKLVKGDTVIILDNKVLFSGQVIEESSIFSEEIGRAHV